MRTLCIVLLAGCTGKPIPKPAPTPTPLASSPIVSAQPTVTRTQADRALHDDAPLDYERPFIGKPLDRSATTKLFHERCEGGDPRACIVESELIGFDRNGRYLTAVVANCRKGDVMSCRALPMDAGPARFPDLPGAMSRSNVCSTPDKPPCDTAKLRQECTDGFAWACFTLGESDTSGAGDALLARYLKLSVEGCRAGIAIECGVAGLSKNDLDRIDAAKRLCDLHRDQCTDLYYAYNAVHDMTNARDALERACQYGNAAACLSLGVSYVDRELAEPVLGRGQALIDWACPKLTEERRGRLLRDQAEKCERATKK